MIQKCVYAHCNTVQRDREIYLIRQKLKFEALPLLKPPDLTLPPSIIPAGPRQKNYAASLWDLPAQRDTVYFILFFFYLGY